MEMHQYLGKQTIMNHYPHFIGPTKLNSYPVGKDIKVCFGHPVQSIQPKTFSSTSDNKYLLTVLYLKKNSFVLHAAKLSKYHLKQLWTNTCKHFVMGDRTKVYTLNFSPPLDKSKTCHNWTLGQLRKTFDGRRSLMLSYLYLAPKSVKT